MCLAFSQVYVSYILCISCYWKFSLLHYIQALQNRLCLSYIICKFRNCCFVLMQITIKFRLTSIRLLADHSKETGKIGGRPLYGFVEDECEGRKKNFVWFMWFHHMWLYGTHVLHKLRNTCSHFEEIVIIRQWKWWNFNGTLNGEIISNCIP